MVRLERLAADIDMIFTARTDQQLKDIQSTLAQKPEQTKQMFLQSLFISDKAFLRAPALKRPMQLPRESERLEW